MLVPLQNIHPRFANTKDCFVLFNIINYMNPHLIICLTNKYTLKSSYPQHRIAKMRSAGCSDQHRPSGAADWIKSPQWRCAQNYDTSFPTPHGHGSNELNNSSRPWPSRASQNCVAKFPESRRPVPASPTRTSVSTVWNSHPCDCSWLGDSKFIVDAVGRERCRKESQG